METLKKIQTKLEISSLSNAISLLLGGFALLFLVFGVKHIFPSFFGSVVFYILIGILSIAFIRAIAIEFLLEYKNRNLVKWDEE